MGNEFIFVLQLLQNMILILGIIMKYGNYVDTELKYNLSIIIL